MKHVRKYKMKIIKKIIGIERNQLPIQTYKRTSLIQSDFMNSFYKPIISCRKYFLTSE